MKISLKGTCLVDKCQNLVVWFSYLAFHILILLLKRISSVTTPVFVFLKAFFDSFYQMILFCPSALIRYKQEYVSVFLNITGTIETNIGHFPSKRNGSSSDSLFFLSSWICPIGQLKLPLTSSTIHLQGSSEVYLLYNLFMMAIKPSSEVTNFKSLPEMTIVDKFIENISPRLSPSK